VKTGVQSIAKTLKTLDSGFRRNDVKKNRTDFFTASPVKGEGISLLFQQVYPLPHGEGEIGFPDEN
jgi:hypothetical protein